MASNDKNMETSNASDIAYERVVYNKRAGCIYYIECYSLDHAHMFLKYTGKKRFRFLLQVLDIISI